MKKFLAVLLAALMIFSMTTVAFAADGDEEETTTTAVADEETTEAEDEDSFDFTELPIWTVLAGAKVGKIVLKIALVFVKIASALGLIDTTEIISNLIDQIQNGTTTDDTTTTTEVAETTVTEAPVAA